MEFDQSVIVKLLQQILSELQTITSKAVAIDYNTDFLTSIKSGVDEIQKKLK